jgi:stage II sporulation protein GA (sporulation sigma-E factor processing peptidase)
MEEKRCEITLYTDSGKERIWALLDTGNVLEDPVSGNPISVLDKAIARRILSDADVKNFHYVPYRTVGKESVMPVFRIQKMCIHLKEETWIEKPMIGVSEGRVSEQETYQMILNPDVLGGI